MGIKKFYNKWFINSKNPNDKTAPGNHPGVISKDKPELVSCLFFDLNSLIHNAAGKVFCYNPKPDPKRPKDMSKKDKEEYYKRYEENSKKTDDELELELQRETCIMIYKSIKQFNPQDYVVLAVDGVAPMAKITQQRSRRYKKAQDSKPPPTADKPLEYRFDSNCITPGTDFMFRLDLAIQLFIRDAIRDAHFEVKNIIYSSHLTPGEGEHKIFDILRQKDNGVVPGDGVNVVIGADADLFMLCLLSKTPYLVLCRETNIETTYIDIDVLRHYLFQRMTGYGALELPNSIVIQDFVLITFTIGNDFLPQILSFEDVKDSMNLSFTSYLTLGLPLTDDNGQILWDNYLKFIQKISKKEQSLLENMKRNTDYGEHPYVALEEAYSRTFDKEKAIEGTFADVESAVIYKVDMKKLSDGWYRKVFSPRHPDAMNILKKFKAESLWTQNTTPYIQEMCLEYFKGMQWIMRYYLTGQSGVSSRYIYVYHYAPLVQDMFNVLSEVISIDGLKYLPTTDSISANRKDPIITPIHQLLMVQPKSSWDLIPGKFRYLLDDPLRDISPINFEADSEGRQGDKTYTDIAILSIVDPIRVIDITEQFPIPDKYLSVKTKFVLNAYHKKIPFIPMNLKELQKFEQKQANKLPPKKKPVSERMVQAEIIDTAEEAIEESITDVVVLPKYTKPEKPGVVKLGWKGAYVM